jgi:tRNA(fMet)-specific endonuclease VapC
MTSEADGYLADTSIFIAAELGRLSTAENEPPRGDARISVVTLTELSLGVRMSRDDDVRERRHATLASARRFIALPYDEAVAERLAQLLAALKAARERAGAFDAVIAATALVHGLTVWTQDADFERFAALEPELRVQVASG